MSPQSPGRFVALDKLVEEFLGRSRGEFLAAYQDALLIFDDVGEASQEPHFHTISSRPDDNGSTSRDRDTLEAAVGKILGRLSGSSSKWIVPLENREGKFACILTLGRAANNNLRLNVASLSKFHAYFTHVARDGSWYLSDANSSNGTFLDGEELPPSHGKVRLANGAFLRFGPDVTGQFFVAADFWDLFQSCLDDDTPEASSRPGAVEALPTEGRRGADDAGSGEPPER